MRLKSWLESAIWFASPERARPLSVRWGFDRGTPVDRWYIERWLADQTGDIRGSVLEAMDARYTERFGVGITESQVLDVDSANREATLVADLQRPKEFPELAFDCVILTQTLQYVYDLPAAVAAIHRTLRPGGVCLASVPIVSRIDPAYPPGHEYWR